MKPAADTKWNGIKQKLIRNGIDIEAHRAMNGELRDRVEGCGEADRRHPIEAGSPGALPREPKEHHDRHRGGDSRATQLREADHPGELGLVRLALELLRFSCCASIPLRAARRFQCVPKSRCGC